LVWTSICHDSSVVGRLKQRIAGSDDGQWADIACHPKARRKQWQDDCSKRHGNQSDDAHSVSAKPVNEAPGGRTRQCGNNWAGRHNKSDTGCVEPKRARKVERADHQCCHNHGRHQCAHDEARTQYRIAKHGQLD
jgi:hypothetical protein